MTTALTPARETFATAQASRPDWVTKKCGRTRWQVQAELLDELFAGDRLDWDGWNRDGRVETVKSGTHRTVHRLRLDSGNYYIKHFRISDWKSAGQNLIRPCKARLEWNAARQVAAAGIRTFVTVAFGRSKFGWYTVDNFLISREIADAEPLDEYLSSTLLSSSEEAQAKVRREIVSQLAELTARLHVAGLQHCDLHVGNILVRRNEGEGETELSLWLIDLHAVIRRRWFRRGHWLEGLCMLHNYFGRRSTAAERYRFLLTYRRQVARLLKSPIARASQLQQWVTERSIDELSAEVGDACQAELRVADRRGDLKWRRGNRRLVIFQDEPRCRAVAEVDADWLREVRRDPHNDLPETGTVAVPLRDGTLATAKVFHPRHSDAPRNWSAVRNAWETGHALSRRGIPIARPLLMREAMCVDEVDLLVIQQPTGAEVLTSWLSQERDEAELRGAAASAGRLLGSLHREGYAAPLLTTDDLLVVTDKQGSVRVELASSDNVRETGWTRPTVPVTFALSTHAVPPIRHAHRLRFLRGLLGGEFGVRWKEVWRELSPL